mgnify:FL=1
MIYEEIDGFTEGLIEKTKMGKLKWMPLSSFHKMRDLDMEFDNGFASIDFGVNSIRENNSYYFKFNDGYVFLFEIYHGDPEVTSPEMDALALMVKINSAIPIENLSSHMGNEEHQEDLATLKLLVEHYLEEKYCMPDALYKFMQKILNDDDQVYDFVDEDGGQ